MISGITLEGELRKAKERLRHKKHVILGCIRQPGLEVKMFTQRSVSLDPHQ